ncbi:MAG: permease-like cell division protein FtsX [Candidatus Magasanikiibacteriota bacterium]
MLSLLRIIKFALQDMFRNFSLSFMTILILVLMLLSVNTFVIVNFITSQAVQTVKDQIDVSVYFASDAPDVKIEEVKSFIDSFPEVTEIIYLDRDQVLVQFKEQHKDNAEIMASVDELGTNPLGPTMIVKTREPQDYQKVITALTIPEYENIIEAKTFGDTQKAIDRIYVITTQVERFTVGISILFAIIAFLIIFNTIRVAIYTQRIEISIKKLVGATNWFVRGPYLVESLVFSMISLVFGLIFTRLALYVVDPYITIIFQKPNILTDYYTAHLLYLILVQFLVVLFLTLISSLLAMRKHLRA